MSRVENFGFPYQWPDTKMTRRMPSTSILELIGPRILFFSLQLSSVVFHQCRRPTCLRYGSFREVFSWGFPWRAIPEGKLKQRGFSPSTFGFGPTYSFALSSHLLALLLAVLFMGKERIKRIAENAGIEFLFFEVKREYRVSETTGVFDLTFSRLKKYLYPNEILTNF